MKTNFLKPFMLLFFIFNLITFGGFAQKGISFTADLNPQVSWMLNSDDSDLDAFSQKAYVRPAFGLGATYNFTDNLGLGADVRFSMQGRKAEVDNVETSAALDYLKVPLYFSYNTNPAKNIQFVGKIGPQVSFLSNARLLDAEGEEIDHNIMSSYENVTVGGFLSLGAEYRLTPMLNVFTLARCDMDFTNAEDNEVAGYIDGRSSTHNATIGIQAGVRLKFSK
ncbi:MAG: outer membrane beta-barrel protein [Bacteroidales bacterium]|nr:outer membrane beta-barrel protein [Bacteroidales bacterium]